MKGSDNQEKLVYQIIEDAGNKGISLTKNIRYNIELALLLKMYLEVGVEVKV